MRPDENPGTWRKDGPRKDATIMSSLAGFPRKRRTINAQRIQFSENRNAICGQWQVRETTLSGRTSEDCGLHEVKEDISTVVTMS